MSSNNKLFRHVKKHKDSYALIGIGVIIGLKLSNKPKVNEAAVIQAWAAKMVKDGYSIYALTEQQKSLWNATWDYLEAYAKDWNLPVEQAINDIVRTYTMYAEEAARA